jgi:chromosome segregation ATPase
MKKINLELISIGLLTAIIIFLLYLLAQPQTDYENEIKRLKTENKTLKNERESLSENILSLENEFSELKKKEFRHLANIKKLESQINDYKEIAEISENSLFLMKENVKKTEQKIKDFKNNPPNRTGEDLIISLRNKTPKN